MATLQDVANKAGVSTSTVSRILHGKGKFTSAVQKNVHQAIKELNYQPNSNAQALASNKVALVGIITPNIAAPFYGRVASGGAATAREHQYKTLIANSFRDAEDELNAIYSFVAQGCRNIILHSMTLSDEKLIELARQIKGLVILGRYVEKIANRCVWIDNVKASKLAAEYILQKGHKKVAVLSYAQTQCDPSQRLTGAKLAFMEAGLEIPEDLIIFNDGQVADGRLSVQKLLDNKAEFTAIIAYNDLIAIGAIKELVKRGIKVPQDVSVIGFDNLFLAEISTPELTSVNYPIEEMSRYAVELSIRLTEQPNIHIEQTHLFISSIVERDSTADVNQNLVAAVVTS
ncbi:LacI family DNA-binding transcriptional regulator [Catenovulum sediminis]|uniref:LacI family DNA-binding transcriptional regulator n=1 Tax=Catenovulum sediminis TaxID=1740262 RepID=A0ABV1RD11_9ALTE